jgi:hypothetical protein
MDSLGTIAALAALAQSTRLEPSCFLHRQQCPLDPCRKYPAQAETINQKNQVKEEKSLSEIINAYSLFKEAAEDLNSAPGEIAMMRLVLRDLGGLRTFVRETPATGLMGLL